MQKLQVMKTPIKFLWLSPIVLFIAGCAAPVHEDTTISQWQREGLLPATGSERSRVYAETETSSYPAQVPNIVVEQGERNKAGTDRALAESIRQQVQYDRGLTPSLEHVTVAVQDGQIFLRGTVKSDLDARIIVDDLRDISGVTRISNQLVINPNVDNLTMSQELQ